MQVEAGRKQSPEDPAGAAEGQPDVPGCVLGFPVATLTHPFIPEKGPRLGMDAVAWTL